jgi:hypothetical protein
MNGNEIQGQSPAPPDLRTCIQAGNLGVRCAGCEIASCDIRATGELVGTLLRVVDQQDEVMVGLRMDISEAEQRYQTALAERDAERATRIAEQRDPVIPNFLTSIGVMARIEADPMLAEELTEGRAGVIYIDLRGLHAKNETLGDPAGDFDLQQGGERLTSAHNPGENIDEAFTGSQDEIAGTGQNGKGGKSGGVRLEKLETDGSAAPPELPESVMRLETAEHQEALEHEPERRMHPTYGRDIGYRGNGADELVVLVRNVTPRQLREIAMRVEELFSVDRAIIDSANGKLPLVATVAHAHVDELNLEYTKAVDIFQAVHASARERHENMKTEQYAEMWDMARRAARVKGMRLRKPSDPRLIYQAFMEHCCPEFAENARAFYQANGVRVKPANGGGHNGHSEEAGPTGTGS